jgi:hypothetical protein
MWRLWTEEKSTAQLQARGRFTLYSGYKLILIVDDPVATVKYRMIRPNTVFDIKGTFILFRIFYELIMRRGV